MTESICVMASAELRERISKLNITADDFECRCPGNRPHKPYAKGCMFTEPAPGEPAEFNPYLRCTK